MLFYARNNSQGPVIFRYPVNVTTSDNCKRRGNRCSGRNDQARSMFMPNAGPWSLIIYDSPDGETDDDYADIRSPVATNYKDGKCIASFERNTPEVKYRRHNGLDGKVSRIAVNYIKLR